jgi:methyl-accepting chemotaxis protein
MNLMAERLGILVGNVSKSSTELIQIGNQVEEISNDVMESAQNQVMAVTESETAVKGILASSETLKGKLDTLAIVSEEIASALSQMVATSEEVAQSIDIQAREVDFVSSSILEMATSIGQTNEHIASLVEDSMTTASSIAHMDDEIKAVEKNAIGTAIETDKALKDAEMGEATVEATVASMVEIRAISHETAEKVSELSDKVAAIDSILKVIDEVSEQTNLLALNAAIIAAQAGEHGKGFAVVADEIKELAARTVVSTSEIAAVIQTIQKETKSVVESIFTVTHRIDDGVSLSRKSGEALSQIVTSVGKALLQVNEIAKSTTEHAAESKRIKGAIERITNMVEHVATASAEQARGAKQISVAAEQMQSLTTHVRTASVEQAATSENITSRTFENVRMIDDIRELSTKNDAMARKVAEEATIINLAAQHNLEGTTGLNQAMNSLIAQSKNLKTELGKFK